MNNHEIARLLGQAAKVIVDVEGKNLPASVMDALLMRPAAGLGMLHKLPLELAPKHQEMLAQILNQLPADLPDGPVSIEDQGGFWMGYYKSLPKTNEKPKMSSIHIDQVEAERKAAYVKAAQRDGMKLVPWVLHHLDRAAASQPCPPEN